MNKLNQKGIAHLLILIVLVLGLFAVLYLVSNRTNWLPKASVSGPVGPSTTFQLSSGASAAKVGDIIPVKLNVRADVSPVNLLNAKIAFDRDLLAVDKIDYTDSIVKNWVEQYSDNPTGTISLVGGIPSPGFQTTVDNVFSPVAVIYLKALKEGTGNVAIVDGSAIYTNADNIDILSSKDVATFSIVPVTSTPTPSPIFTCTACAADVDKSGGVDVDDYSYLVNCYNKDLSYKFGDNKDKSCLFADINRDEKINEADNVCLQQQYSQTCPSNLISKAPACEIYGDLNLDGKVSTADSQMVMDIYLGRIKIQNSTTQGDTQYMQSVGDVNGDTKVDTTDAQIIQQYIEAKTNTYPVCQNAKASPCYGKGDVTGDGKITPMDAYETLRINLAYPNSLYTNKPYTHAQTKAADTDGDNEVTAVDALHILRYINGDIATLKACASPIPSATPAAGTGDGNKDGKVDLIDLSVLLTDYNKNQGIRTGIDMNKDGVINAFDFGLLRNLLIQKGVVKG